MDDEDLPTINETAQWSSCAILFCLRTLPYTYDVQIDESDAFQNTHIDGSDPKVKSTRERHVEQPPGFVVPGPNGETRGPDSYVWALNVAWQGMPDSAKLFGDRHDVCLRECGFVPSIWDPKFYIYLNCPDLPVDAPIQVILKMTHGGGWHNGRPIGYMVIAQHVDDGIAVTSNMKLAEWVVERLRIIWPTTMGRWRKVLGIDLGITQHSNGYSTVELSAPGILDGIRHKYLADEIIIKPKHIMSPQIEHLGPGSVPPEGSPERAPYLQMQTNSRALMGTGLFLPRAYPQATTPFVLNCEHMNNPGHEGFKTLKHASMHLIAFPTGIRYGTDKVEYNLIGIAKTSCPFQLPFVKDFGLHMFTDGALARRAISGVTILLAGGIIDSCMQRQHLTAPDVHTVELVAGTTGLHKIIVIRGKLQEMHIYQEFATPHWMDSLSTVAVANNKHGPKRSLWNARRHKALVEGVELEEIMVRHIEGRFNVANYFTKYEVLNDYLMHKHYFLNMDGAPPHMGAGANEVRREAA